MFRWITTGLIVVGVAWVVALPYFSTGRSGEYLLGLAIGATLVGLPRLRDLLFKEEGE